MLLNRSRKKTIQKYFFPSSRATFVAPMFPDPALRGSTPLAKPTIRPKGIEPMTYASGMRMSSHVRGMMGASMIIPAGREAKFRLARVENRPVKCREDHLGDDDQHQR